MILNIKTIKKNIGYSCAIGLLCACIGAGLSYNMPNQYRASSILQVNEYSAPNTNQLNMLNGVSQIFGGQESKSLTVRLSLLRSRRFIYNFIKNRSLLIEIAAMKDWDTVNNRAIIDPNIFNSETNQWVMQKRFWEITEQKSGREPRADIISNIFLKKFLNISKDVKTDIITLSIKHYSPQRAETILSWFIEDINSYVRKRDLAEGRARYSFLKKQLKMTDSVTIQASLSNLIEHELQKLMLNELQKDYAFTVLDPPLVPSKKFAPQRSLIVFFSFFLGFLISLTVLLGHSKLRESIKVSK